jgi:hypothetical protein
MSLAPAETASSVQAETRSASRKDQRPDFGFGRERITDPQCRHTSAEAVEKRALEVRMDVDPLHRHADLAGMVIAALRQWLDQPVAVGAAVDDRRRGTTMLQRATRSRRQLGAERPANAARTNKAQEGDPRIQRETRPQQPDATVNATPIAVSPPEENAQSSAARKLSICGP